MKWVLMGRRTPAKVVAVSTEWGTTARGVAARALQMMANRVVIGEGIEIGGTLRGD